MAEGSLEEVKLVGAFLQGVNLEVGHQEEVGLEEVVQLEVQLGEAVLVEA